MLSCKSGVVHVLVIGYNTSLSKAVNVANFIANTVQSDKCVLLHCQDMAAGHIITDLLPGAGLVEASDDSALEDWYRSSIILDINDF
jgi:hypothetical protein